MCAVNASFNETKVLIVIFHVSVVTGYLPTAGGVRPLLTGTANSVVSQPNMMTPPIHRPVVPAQTRINNGVAQVRPVAAPQGNVLINPQGLPAVQQAQHLAVATPPQTPPLSTAQTATSVAQPPSQSQTHQEGVKQNNVPATQMETDQTPGLNQHEACLPTNRPPSRRRSYSGSSAHGSPPLSPRTRSPKSPRSKSPKPPRPVSPKGPKVSTRNDIDINSDTSHAQMERIGEDVRVPVQETAIEKVENPGLKVPTDQTKEPQRPNTRRKSSESRTNQNGNVKMNGNTSVKLCTNLDIVSSRTNDESHTRTDALHMNGDVLSPAPSDSSTATSDPMSPKRNGANPATSPSILDKKAKIAQLLQDTAAAKEALGLGQNGIAPHLGNRDSLGNKDVDQTSQDDLPTAEGLTKQVTEAAALMPETNGCDDTLLSESTDGANDRLHEDEDDMILSYSTDGTNDKLQEDSETSSTGTVPTVTMSHVQNNLTQPVITTTQPSQHQGTASQGQTQTASSLEGAPEQSSQSIVPGNQIHTQVINVNTPNVPAQSSLATAKTVSSANSDTAPATADKPGSAAIAELLQRKLLNSSQQQGASFPQEVSHGNPSAASIDSQANVQATPRLPVSGGIAAAPVRPTLHGAQPGTQQSHLMQQLQQRLQRPNQNTQMPPGQLSQTSGQTSQSQQQPGANINGTAPSVTSVTTTHAAVQQQLLQRLRAPQNVQVQVQQSPLQQRLQTPQGTSSSQLSSSQVQSEPQLPARPSSTGPPSRPPSRPPSAGPQVRPPSTGPVPMPSPGGSSDSGTLPPASPTPARRSSTASTASTDSKVAGSVKAKKRKAKSNSIESRRSSNASASSEVQYMCEWNKCNA